MGAERGQEEHQGWESKGDKVQPGWWVHQGATRKELEHRSGLVEPRSLCMASTMPKSSSSWPGTLLPLFHRPS